MTGTRTENIIERRFSFIARLNGGRELRTWPSRSSSAVIAGRATERAYRPPPLRVRRFTRRLSRPR